MFFVTLSLHGFTLVIENQMQSTGDTDLLRWQQMKVYVVLVDCGVLRLLTEV